MFEAQRSRAKRPRAKGDGAGGRNRGGWGHLVLHAREGDGVGLTRSLGGSGEEDAVIVGGAGWTEEFSTGDGESRDRVVRYILSTDWIEGFGQPDPGRS